jgi:hypothetical protein
MSGAAYAEENIIPIAPCGDPGPPSFLFGLLAITRTDDISFTCTPTKKKWMEKPLLCGWERQLALLDLCMPFASPPMGCTFCVLLVRS